MTWQPNLSLWMTELQQSRSNQSHKLSDLHIPGSRASSTWQASKFEPVRHQRSDLYVQCKLGIRYFDICVRGEKAPQSPAYRFWPCCNHVAHIGQTSLCSGDDGQTDENTLFGQLQAFYDETRDQSEIIVVKFLHLPTEDESLMDEINAFWRAVRGFFNAKCIQQGQDMPSLGHLSSGERFVILHDGYSSRPLQQPLQPDNQMFFDKYVWQPGSRWISVLRPQPEQNGFPSNIDTLISNMSDQVTHDATANPQPNVLRIAECNLEPQFLTALPENFAGLVNARLTSSRSKGSILDKTRIMALDFISIDISHAIVLANYS